MSKALKNTRQEKKLNICLLLHHDYVSWNGWVRSVFTEIYARYLSSFGHSITWLLSCTGEIDRQLFKSVHAHPVFYREGISPPGRLWGELTLVCRKLRAMNRLLSSEKFDLVQAGDTLIDGMLAACAKRRFNIPFVFKRDDIMSGKWHSSSGKYWLLRPVYSVLGWLGGFILYVLLHQADLVVVVSRFMKERLLTQGIPESRILAIRRGANTSQFQADTTGEEAKTKYGLADCSPVIYVGATSRVRQLDILLRAFASVTAQRRDAKLVIAGSGDKGYLSELASSLGIQEDTVFTGQVPYSEVPSLIAAAKVAVCPLPPLDIYRVSSPTKLFEYMAMGKPVVANEEIPEHKDVLEQSDGGILVQYDEGAFAQAIIRLLDNPEEAANMGREGRRWVEENASYEFLARQVEKAYFELLDRMGKIHE